MKKYTFIFIFCLVGFSTKIFAQSNDTAKVSRIQFISLDKGVIVETENVRLNATYNAVYCKNNSSNYFGIIFIKENGIDVIREVEIPYQKVKRILGKID